MSDPRFHDTKLDDAFTASREALSNFVEAYQREEVPDDVIEGRLAALRQCDAHLIRLVSPVQMADLAEQLFE